MSIHDTFVKRMRYAVDMDPRSSKTIARRAGYSEGYLSALTGRGSAKGRNPTIGAVWALAGELGVHPLWLLGSDLHAGPERRTDQPVTVAPKKLPPEVWPLVEAMRAEGEVWPDIARRVRRDFGFIVHHASLRRAWSHRQK